MYLNNLPSEAKSANISKFYRAKKIRKINNNSG